MSAVEEALSTAEYWDKHYSKSDGLTPTHEWFRSFADLEEFFQSPLFEAPESTPPDNPVILHLGSGDSVIPLELDSRGYRPQICVDFSSKIVETMAERHRDRPGIEWRCMDVRNMVDIADKSIGVAFDKGTLDAMVHGSPWSPPPEVRENTAKYLAEVHRVLSDDGIFLYVTFRQPHFMRSLLNQQGLWDLDLQILGGHNGGFEYYGWVIRKAKSKEEKL
ncbi:S-adenosyl-L-methionine-dependent methyltransferase [Chaetomium tenue]|uniref:S-adenosyl-L-methionine-dependent methyltransferase n=1 Tax=Chaetomium tenue TaxID=1854479 RepID=A0ACB7PQW9_9PEZI|nr:S-adenosyl-L-methionine-dependent methyltransferase [Chaetomium globosum]